MGLFDSLFRQDEEPSKPAARPQPDYGGVFINRREVLESQSQPQAGSPPSNLAEMHLADVPICQVGDISLDRFTDGGRAALTQAQGEAISYQHNYIETDHLLLGMLRVQSDIAAKALTRLRVSIDTIRAAREKFILRGKDEVRPPLNLTPHARQVIESAERNTRIVGGDRIGTAHLLLGLLEQHRDDIGRGLLDMTGADPQRLRALIIDELRQVLSTHEKQTAVVHNLARELFPANYAGDGEAEVLQVAKDRWPRNYQSILANAYATDLTKDLDIYLDMLTKRGDFGPPLPPIVVNIDQLASVRNRPKIDASMWAVITDGMRESDSLWHAYLGPEHLVLGLLHHPDEPGGRQLVRVLGVDLETARHQVVRMRGRGGKRRYYDPQTSTLQVAIDADQAIEWAVTVAERYGDPSASAGHLLIGLIVKCQTIMEELLSIREQSNTPIFHAMNAVDEELTLQRAYRTLSHAPSETLKPKPTYCTSCGVLLEPQWAFCRSCGARVQ